VPSKAISASVQAFESSRESPSWSRLIRTAFGVLLVRRATSASARVPNSASSQASHGLPAGGARVEAKTTLDKTEPFWHKAPLSLTDR
jgi:hypothetical protein